MHHSFVREDAEKGQKWLYSCLEEEGKTTARTQNKKADIMAGEKKETGNCELETVNAGFTGQTTHTTRRGVQTEAESALIRTSGMRAGNAAEKERKGKRGSMCVCVSGTFLKRRLNASLNPRIFSLLHTNGLCVPGYTSRHTFHRRMRWKEKQQNRFCLSTSCLALSLSATAVCLCVKWKWKKRKVIWTREEASLVSRLVFQWLFFSVSASSSHTVRWEHIYSIFTFPTSDTLHFLFSFPSLMVLLYVTLDDHIVHSIHPQHHETCFSRKVNILFHFLSDLIPQCHVIHRRSRKHQTIMTQGRRREKSEKRERRKE